jgi:hypothetical protein
LEQHHGVEAVEKFLGDWRRAKPNSLAASIAEADNRVSAAWRARGSGYAGTVRQSEWKTFEEQMQKAKRALAETDKIKDQFDPHVFHMRILIGTAMNAERKEMDAVVTEAIDKCPGYDKVYRTMAYYLLPKWHGEFGDVRKFADDIHSRLPHPLNDIMYARIAWEAAGSERGEFFVNTGFNYDKLRTACETLLKEYPGADENMRQLLMYSCLAKDRETAKRMFTTIADLEYSDYWVSRDRIKIYQKWAMGQIEDPDEKSPLEKAIEEENPGKVDRIISAGADVNARSVEGIPLLMVALENKSTSIALALAKAGADLNAKTENGFTVATAAVRAENPEVLNMILEGGFPINSVVTPGGLTLLHVAAFHN